MVRGLKVAAVAAACIVGPGLAHAADFNAAYGTPSYVPTWTGFYGGFHAGYGFGDVTDSLECGFESFVLGSVSVINGFGTADTFCEDGGADVVSITALANAEGDPPWITIDDLSDVGGPFGGIQLGYLHQNGHIVFGAELSGSIAAMTDKGTTLVEIDFDGPGEAIYDGYFDVSGLVTAVARMGFAPNERVLISANGGLAMAAVEFQSSAGYSDGGVVPGWTAGAQVDVMLGHNVSMFAAYSYMQFLNMEFHGTSAAGFISNWHEYDLGISTVKVGLNRHFN